MVHLCAAAPYVVQMYVALFPCNECCKVIIQSGITEVVYMSDKYADTPSMRASRRMFDMAKVEHVPTTTHTHTLPLTPILLISCVCCCCR